MTILLGDCRTILPTLDAGSVRCCVTSPPYWGLRDYGTATWEGGSAECEHLRPAMGGIKASTLNAKRDDNGWLASDGHSRPNLQAYAGVCGKCGARRIDAQLGLERTPEEYVAAMVGVFRAVKRVLADDGTLWLNLGDSYAGGGQGGGGSFDSERPGWRRDKASVPIHPRSGLKPKDLVGIPWRVAFALQADGWYLRSDIIWHKPNPMPESVTDRPTKSHEYVFLLSKNQKYFYDAGAIREPHQDVNVVNGVFQGKAQNRPDYKPATQGFNKSDGTPGGIITKHRDYNPAGRNARTVWTIPTQPTPDAHFATFPESLAERCILAGSAQGDTVLDPFFGSGTVGKVAERLGRKWVGIELNPAYVGISERKTAQRGMFA